MVTGVQTCALPISQRISIRGARPEAFAKVNHPRLFLKDITAGKGAIATGDLQGNRFSILVRTPTASQVEESESVWQSRFAHVAEQGFYNFFYLQRFSSPRYINHEWGRDIIGGNYEKAVRSILCDESPTELPFFGEMRRWFREHYGSWKDIREFVDETFPEALYVERALAAHLEAHPGDFVGALRTNEKQVMMWVYAYSSKLFNESISSYIQSGREVPAALPLVVSHDRGDIALYRRMLERDGLFPPNWMHLRPFPSIRTAHREVHTKSKVQLHRVKLVPEGVRCSFILEKGEYATTFLAHLFNLVGGIDRETDTEFSRTEVSHIDPSTRAYFDAVLTKADEPEDI
jgi:tRNA(Glu) U13 pseudouridine synthase TruD